MTDRIEASVAILAFDFSEATVQCDRGLEAEGLISGHPLRKKSSCATS